MQQGRQTCYQNTRVHLYVESNYLEYYLTVKRISSQTAHLLHHQSISMQETSTNFMYNDISSIIRAVQVLVETVEHFA